MKDIEQYLNILMLIKKETVTNVSISDNENRSRELNTIALLSVDKMRKGSCH